MKRFLAVALMCIVLGGVKVAAQAPLAQGNGDELTPADIIQVKRFIESNEPFKTVYAAAKTYMLSVEGDYVNYAVNQGGQVVAQGKVAMEKILGPAPAASGPAGVAEPVTGAAGGSIQDLRAWRYEVIDSASQGKIVERVEYSAEELETIEQADLAWLEQVFANFNPPPQTLYGDEFSEDEWADEEGDEMSDEEGMGGAAPAMATAGPGYYTGFDPMAGGMNMTAPVMTTSPDAKTYAEWYYFYSQLQLWEQYIQRILRTTFTTKIPQDFSQITTIYPTLGTQMETTRQAVAKQEFQTVIDLYARLDGRTDTRERYRQFQRERMIEVQNFVENWVGREREEVVEIGGVRFIPTQEPMTYVPRDAVNLVTTKITPYDLLDEEGSLRKPEGQKVLK